MDEPLHEALHEAYDVDVAKLNRLAARSAERAEALKAENEKLRELVRSVLVLRHDSVFKWLDAATAEVCGTSFTAQARELGIEESDD